MTSSAREDKMPSSFHRTIIDIVEKKHQHQHGIAPPLKNVRRRRFRKTLKKKPIDLASIEKEVKRLLRMDMEAIDVKWEEVADDTTTAAGWFIFIFCLHKDLKYVMRARPSIYMRSCYPILDVTHFQTF